MSRRPPLDNQPQLFTRTRAAAYLQLAQETFSAWLRRGIIPGPLEGTNRYDQKDLDAAMDELSSDFEAWLSSRRARKASAS